VCARSHDHPFIVLTETKFNENGKRASEGVNDAPAATQAKTTTLSTDQQSFVLKFLPAAAKINKKRKITTPVLFSLGVRGVCVRCGYEDRIHVGRILEALSGLDKD
jgi:hypothetical protein